MQLFEFGAYVVQFVTFCGEQVLLLKKVPFAQVVQLFELGAY